MKKANGFWSEFIHNTVKITGLGVGALVGQWLWDIVAIKLGIKQ